ncbi:MAG: YfhO family protein [Legionella sp.]|jgi:hypothetical protein
MQFKEEKSWKKEGFFILFLLLSLLIFFNNAFFGIDTLIWDSADYFYPNFFYVNDSLRQGKMPLWNPYLFNGFPIIGNIETQLFYPLNLLMFPFTTYTPYMVHLNVILHFFIAGASMYALARYLIDSRFAAIFSSLAYMYSGFMVGHIEHVTMIDVMAWLPLIFLFLEKAFAQEKMIYAVYAGFFLGLSILAGHPQTSHAMGFLLVSYSIYRGISIYIKTKQKKAIIFCLCALTICFVLSVLLAAVQLLPTYEVTQEATRGTPVSLAIASAGGQLSFKDVISIFLPNYFGSLVGPYWGEPDISQHILYIGIISTLLVGIAVLYDQKRAGVAFFSIMALLSLLLATGTNGPLYNFFYSYVPGFHYFRGPVHTRFIYVFCTSLLAGFGVSVLMQPIKKERLYRYLCYFTLICAVIYLFSPNPPQAFMIAAIKNIHVAILLAVTVMLLAIILILLSIHFPKYKPFFLTLLFLLSFTDLYLHFSNAKTIAVKASPSVYEVPPQIVNTIKGHSGIKSSDIPGIELNESELGNGLFRLYTKPEGVFGTIAVGVNRAMTFRSFLVEGFEPLELRRHRILISTLATKNLNNLLKITSSKYVIDRNKGSVSINPDPLSRAFIVPNARFIEDDDKMLDHLSKNDPSTEVVLASKGIDITGQSMPRTSWDAKISSYEGNRVVLNTHSSHDGFLVLSDTFYPNWHASIDGVETPVLRANYDFRAIYLPKGDHAIVFEYLPYLFPGVFISLITFLCVIFCFLIYKFPDSYNKVRGFCMNKHLR